ncbi:uncharacterized protein LOC122456680 isoform X2 [Dermochelys coriacea]|uniref:uncharacterized protein LOC122456680 isoform X2 n=1 Tax=Dermochelys coriacea TaxID=27794 RepID=UPI001CA8FDD8|nr:uncharacterized protein LOC122456680 isoform X2 [Dermochelys coriacea]
MPTSDPHLSCLRHLGAAQRKGRCQICREFEPPPDRWGSGTESSPDGGSMKAGIRPEIGLGTEQLRFGAEHGSRQSGLAAPPPFAGAQGQALRVLRQELLPGTERGQARRPGQCESCARLLSLAGTAAAATKDTHAGHVYPAKRHATFLQAVYQTLHIPSTPGAYAAARDLLMLPVPGSLDVLDLASPAPSGGREFSPGRRTALQGKPPRVTSPRVSARHWEGGHRHGLLASPLRPSRISGQQISSLVALPLHAAIMEPIAALASQSLPHA